MFAWFQLEFFCELSLLSVAREFCYSYSLLVVRYRQSCDSGEKPTNAVWMCMPPRVRSEGVTVQHMRMVGTRGVGGLLRRRRDHNAN
jgi:hypothetical protein